MTHPYRNQPAFARWKDYFSTTPLNQFDPLTSFPFKISKDDKVATAGSCFAQHIARRLSASGFHYLVTEKGHPLANAETQEEYGFGVFTARYGNIYTARQLLQLFQEAFGVRAPAEPVWHRKESFIDPLRPAVEPDGFRTEQEVVLSRRQHLAAVRKMFEELDVFVFTLGLTEAWIARKDGTVFPLCPGVHGGVFSDNDYVFHNFTVAEITEYLEAFLKLLRTVNPTARVIFTVSPVPLAATARDQHVLVSTVYSKSVLRVVCEQVVSAHADSCAYFPSYEVICGIPNRGEYFAPDLRSVTETGVDHVMQIFFRHVATDAMAPDWEPPAPQEDDFVSRMVSVHKAICEEELLTASESD